MELLNVVKARTVWLFDISDLNPRGKSIEEDLIDWLKDAYNFTKAPSSPQDLDESKALVFTGGSFQVREEYFINVDLRIYNDGLIADTRSSTEDSEAFLKDMLESAAKEFNLVYSARMIRKKLYTSEIDVRTEGHLHNLNPKLETFIYRLAQITGQSRIEVAGISLWPETMVLHPQIPMQFRFERKLNAPFSENRYYAVAPVQTSQHLELLNDLEKIISVQTDN
jgi:hypothetical protein